MVDHLEVDEPVDFVYHLAALASAIVRIFNSILADEQVLYDDGRELRRETVAALAARLAAVGAAVFVPSSSSAGVALLEGAAASEYPLSGYTVPAFAAEGRMVSA